MGVCRFVDGLGFQAFFGDFSARQCNNLVGNEKSHAVMRPDSYSSCHNHQLKNSLFLKTELRKKRSLHVASRNIDQANKTLDSPTLLFFFFRLKLCHLRTQNGGLPGADEVAVWERNIAPMKGETLQR